MRDPGRLKGSYAKLEELHRKYVPDWRIGQLFSNLMICAQSEKTDIFFMEEDQLISFIEDYLRVG